MDVTTFDIVLRLIFGIILALIAGLGVSVLVYSIAISIADTIKKRKNQKNGNLHITIDKNWKK